MPEPTETPYKHFIPTPTPGGFISPVPTPTIAVSVSSSHVDVLFIDVAGDALTAIVFIIFIVGLVISRPRIKRRNSQ